MLRKRKRLRLINYDYSQQGIYFITICVKNMIHYFGNVTKNEMHLNQFGKIAFNNWLEIPKHFGNIILDDFIVMPNHFHGIVGITNDDSFFVARIYMRSLHNNKNTDSHQTDKTKMLLSKVIQQYKASVTRDINKIPDNNFQWLKSFHDRIIRNERELINVRRYIFYNALTWKENIENKRIDNLNNEYYKRLFR